MITQSVMLLNQFLDLAGFNEENRFFVKDFTNTYYNAYIDGCDKKLIELEKEQFISCHGIPLSVKVTGSILYIGHELYMISMECSNINKDDHLIIEAYLSQLIIDFTSIIQKNVSLQLAHNDFIQVRLESAFQNLSFYNWNQYSNKLDYYIHIICSPQLYYITDHFYFKISPIKDLGIQLDMLLNIYQGGSKC